jgi:hypothetical protein
MGQNNPPFPSENFVDHYSKCQVPAVGGRSDDADYDPDRGEEW